MIQYHTYTYTHKCVDDLSKRMVTWHLFVALKHSVTRFYEYIEKLSAYYHIIDIYIYGYWVVSGPHGTAFINCTCMFEGSYIYLPSTHIYQRHS